MRWVVMSVLVASVMSQSCRTPFGESSRCVSLNNCPLYLSAFQRRPLPANIISFLRASQCGFDGYTPTVCCGTRLPSEQTQSSTNPPRTPPQSTPASSTAVSPAVSEDAAPTPSGRCGIDSDSDRIYGGEFTDLDEFPWMALLGYRTRTGAITYNCGGVLLNKRYVLTAAHCVTGEINNKIGQLTTVRLGEYDTQTDTDCIELAGSRSCAAPHQDISVHRVMPHSGFSSDNINRKDDIALVRLSQRINYNSFVQPICIADPRADVSTGDDVFVAGWGKTVSGVNSPIKLKLRVPVFDKEACARIYRRSQAFLTEKQICAGGEFSKDSCRGDSGGPLMRRNNRGEWEVYGIVSFGKGCGIDGVPGVYTDVKSYLNWILSNMRDSNN